MLVIFALSGEAMTAYGHIGNRIVRQAAEM